MCAPTFTTSRSIWNSIKTRRIRNTVFVHKWHDTSVAERGTRGAVVVGAPPSPQECWRNPQLRVYSCGKGAPGFGAESQPNPGPRPNRWLHWIMTSLKFPSPFLPTAQQGSITGHLYLLLFVRSIQFWSLFVLWYFHWNWVSKCSG